MHGKKKSECEFIGLKNNRLNYKCEEYDGTSNKSLNDLIEKFPRMQICYVPEKRCLSWWVYGQLGKI